MAFIELTSHSGKKIFVNTRHIVFFQIGEGEDKIYTHIVTNDRSILVQETIEQVIKKIKEVK